MDDIYDSIYDKYLSSKWEAREEIEKIIFEVNWLVQETEKELWDYEDKIDLILNKYNNASV